MTCSKPINYKQLIESNRYSNKENEAPEPHHNNHELLSARIGITASSASVHVLIFEILTLNLIFLLTMPATGICFTSSGNTIKLKLTTRNILMYNKHTERKIIV